MKTITIKSLASSGMSADIRDTAIGRVRLTRGFDIFTRPNTLTPYAEMVNADVSSSTQRLVDFLKYVVSGVGTYVYARGVISGTGRAEIYRKSDYSASTWSTFANNSASTGSAVDGVFVEYHGFAYGSNTDGTVWKGDLSGTVAWVDDTAGGALAAACTGNGLVHSKDDILYMPAGNVLASNNAGSWTAAALTLPSRYIITCLSEYGNYLAIACKPISSGKSIVYLWDRDSTVNTLAESIDFGTGSLQIIKDVEGELIGISSFTEPSSSSTPSRLVFRHYSGGVADTFCEIVATGSTSAIQLMYGQKQGQRLYFAGGIYVDGTYRTGIWGVGKNSRGNWIVWYDRAPFGDTATPQGLRGFYIEGSYALISYYLSSVEKTSQSNGSILLYTDPSIIESEKNPDMEEKDRFKMKTLQTLAVSYDPIPSGGQAIIKWKVDGGSFQTGRTETTAGTMTSEISAVEATFIPGREYQFRVESTGGVIVTGIEYKYEVQNTLIT